MRKLIISKINKSVNRLFMSQKITILIEVSNYICLASEVKDVLYIYIEIIKNIIFLKKLWFY